MSCCIQMSDAVNVIHCFTPLSLRGVTRGLHLEQPRLL
jgi:hypothetical protein